MYIERFIEADMYIEIDTDVDCYISKSIALDINVEPLIEENGIINMVVLLDTEL